MPEAEIRNRLEKAFWTPAATIGPMLHKCRATKVAEEKTAIREEAEKLIKKYYACDEVQQKRWLRAFEVA